MPDDTRYYAVALVSGASRHRGTGWVWSRPCPTAGDANTLLKAIEAEGKMSMGFVICAVGDDRQIIHSYTLPRTVRRIIDHYEDLLDTLDDPPPAAGRR